MPTDKQPRNNAAKKTTKSVTSIPTSSTPVSTSVPTSGTARNAILEGNATPDLDEVRKRAYELYEEDGRQDGYHEHHWLRAESEVRSHNSRKKEPREENKNQQRIA